MAKKKGANVTTATNLPDVVQDAITPASQPKKSTPAAKPKPKPEPSGLPDAVTIQAPLGEIDQGYLNRHVEARLTTEQQQQSMRRLLRGLQMAEERLSNGKPVASNADAIRWLLEQMA